MFTSELQPKSVLTIAGSDSSGGAGIQADIKTIAAHGCYGTSAITAVTSQNTTGVQAIHPVPPEFVALQISSILDDVEVHAIKTGMLFDRNVVQAVAGALKSRTFGPSPVPPLVCDPVCISTSGHSLLDPPAVETLITEIFPLAKLVTPNISEAQLFLSHRHKASDISSITDMITASLNLFQITTTPVLLKGGHFRASHKDLILASSQHPEADIISQGLLEGNMEILRLHEPHGHRISSSLVIDILCERSKNITLFVRPRIESSSTHGTGCTLSAAIASNLAHGLKLKDAVRNAVEYTHVGIQTAYPIGKGHGPLNHFHAISPRIVPLPTKINRHPLTRMLIQGNSAEWKAYVEHKFVRLLGQGTLPHQAFTHFIVQDYHYLKYYARAYALLAAKSTTYESIRIATKAILNVLTEVGTHKMFCLSFGITLDALESAREAPSTTAYGAYLIDIGLQGDTTKLLVALLACLLGYGEVGLWLKKQAMVPNSWVMIEDNPYKPWMDDYGGEMYQGAVKLGLDMIEARAVADPPSAARFKEWRQVWERCTRLEKGFWDAAMEAVV